MDVEKTPNLRWMGMSPRFLRMASVSLVARSNKSTGVSDTGKKIRQITL